MEKHANQLEVSEGARPRFWLCHVGHFAAQL